MRRLEGGAPHHNRPCGDRSPGRGAHRGPDARSLGRLAVAAPRPSACKCHGGANLPRAAAAASL
eukprot:4755233-Alexandrium_andersonii.AAC.1